jgi:hypothetical protein
MHVAVQERIGIRAAIVAAPAIGVKRRYGLGVLEARGPKPRSLTPLRL